MSRLMTARGGFFVFVGAFAFLATRCPGLFWHPQLWAEDGLIFFSQSHDPWALVRAYGGYQHLVPRAIAALTIPIRWEWMPLVYHTIALALTSLVSVRLFLARIPAPAAIAGAIAMVAVPTAGEQFGNLANLHMVFTAVLLVNVLEPAPGDRRESVRRAIEILACGLSGPEVVLLAPLALLRVWNWRRLPLARPVLAAWLGAAAVQFVALLIDPKTMIATPAGAVPSPGFLARFAQVLFTLWAGHEHDRHVAAVVGGLVAAMLLALLWRNRTERLPALACLASGLWLLIAGRLESMAWPNPFGWDSRLAYAPCVCFFWAFGWLASSNDGLLRLPAMLFMAAIVVSGMTRWISTLYPWPDGQWTRQVAEYRAGRRIIFFYPGPGMDRLTHLYAQYAPGCGPPGGGK